MYVQVVCFPSPGFGVLSLLLSPKKKRYRARRFRQNSSQGRESINTDDFQSHLSKL